MSECIVGANQFVALFVVDLLVGGIGICVIVLCSVGEGYDIYCFVYSFVYDLVGTLVEIY